MGVADDGKVHTAQRAGMFPFSIFHRFGSGKVPDQTGLYGEFEKRVKFGFSLHSVRPTELRNRQILLQFSLGIRAT
jgi:hypothetical protein